MLPRLTQLVMELPALFNHPQNAAAGAPVMSPVLRQLLNSIVGYALCPAPRMPLALPLVAVMVASLTQFSMMRGMPTSVCAAPEMPPMPVVPVTEHELSMMRLRMVVPPRRTPKKPWKLEALLMIMFLMRCPCPSKMPLYLYVVLKPMGVCAFSMP